MPPCSSGNSDAVLSHLYEGRGLSGNHTSIAPSISPSEGNILQILALVFSTISVASAVLAFYWFIKMRRSFRHDLIMLLIQSDMFKALWFMLFPVVTFSTGPILNTSKFCQVNGFFLALGIEASDIAVFMIALHTALYIFRPRSGGEGGLYPYRHLAYAVWAIFPLLMASLAFVNDDSAYVAEGTYCYLPVRPFWYRLALSWIPRYIIFIIILGIYASIYYYVRYKFHGFTKTGNNLTPNNSQAAERLPPRRPDRGPPPTPTLACHGLIPESRTSSIAETELRKKSSSTMVPVRAKKSNLVTPKIGAHKFMWVSMAAPTGASTPSEVSAKDADSFSGPSTPRPVPAVTFPEPISQHSHHLSSMEPTQSGESSWHDNFVRRFSPQHSREPSQRPSFVDLITMLRSHPNGSESTQMSQLQLVNSRGQTFADAEMLRTRDKIRRQLRFLFIYPLVYIGMWILPFVSNILQYDDKFAVNPPFGLSCITTICICSQAAVDCWLFSTREKPWRHIPGSNGGFWSSLKFWAGWDGVRERTARTGPGKTRDEMVREARAAYQRRDEELAARRGGLAAPKGHTPILPSKKMGRSWWEFSGQDGAMSPVTEDTSNPMENVRAPDVFDDEDGHGSDGNRTLVKTETTRSLDVAEKHVIEEIHVDST